MNSTLSVVSEEFVPFHILALQLLYMKIPMLANHVAGDKIFVVSTEFSDERLTVEDEWHLPRLCAATAAIAADRVPRVCHGGCLGHEPEAWPSAHPSPSASRGQECPLAAIQSRLYPRDGEPCSSGRNAQTDPCP